MKYCRFLLTLCLLLASSSYLYAVNESECEEVFKLSNIIAENPEIKWSLYSFLLGLVLYFVPDEDSSMGSVLKFLGVILLFFGGYGVIFIAFNLLSVIGSIAHWIFQCIVALLVYFLAFSIIPFLLALPIMAVIDRTKINDKKFTFFFCLGIAVSIVIYSMQPSETRDKINFFPKESLFDVIHDAIYIEAPLEDNDLDDYDQ